MMLVKSFSSLSAMDEDQIAREVTFALSVQFMDAEQYDKYLNSWGQSQDAWQQYYAQFNLPRSRGVRSYQTMDEKNKADEDKSIAFALHLAIQSNG